MMSYVMFATYPGASASAGTADRLTKDFKEATPAAKVLMAWAAAIFSLFLGNHGDPFRSKGFGSKLGYQMTHSSMIM